MDKNKWIKKTESIAFVIRKRVLEHTIKNDGGYLSQACSSAEILAALYSRLMNLEKLEKPLKPATFAGVPGTDNPNSFTGAAFNGIKKPELDRFFLSPSQYSLVLYAALIETGRMSEDGLEDFNKDGSVVEMIGAEHSPGMEIMSGSLGQGISQAAGIALAKKLKNETGKVWIFMSDGEFQIGQTWEAIQAMAFHKLDNITVLIDLNGYQCDGKMENVMNIEPLEKRIEAFGAEVLKIDGHDLEALENSTNKGKRGKPLFIICSTDPARGIPLLKERAPKYHYLRFINKEEKEKYRTILVKMKSVKGEE